MYTLYTHRDLYARSSEATRNRKAEKQDSVIKDFSLFSRNAFLFKKPAL